MPLVDQFGVPYPFSRSASTATRAAAARPKGPTTSVATWTYADAVAALEHHAYAAITAEAYETNRAIAEDQDYWQDGAGWVGPNAGGVGEVWRLLQADIYRQFTPVDVVGEALTRFANALLKTEPVVDFVPLEPAGELKDGVRQPSEAQLAEATAARAAVATWWDRVKLWRQARVVTKRARWSTRGALRVYVDESQMTPGSDGRRTLPSDLSLTDAFARVELAAPEPTDVAVVRDPVSNAPVGILLYTRENERGQETNVAQTWTRTADRNGVSQITVRDIPERGRAQEYTVGLDRLPFAEMTAELLITDPVRRQAKRTNFSESSVVRVAETSSFRERYFGNMEPTGVWAEGPPLPGEDVAKLEAKPDGTVIRRLLRVPLTLGAGVYHEMVGIEKGGKDNERATPTVTIADAMDPEFVLKTSRHSRATMLQSMSQGHVLDAATQQKTSGYSQEQARTDFEDDATNAKSDVESMLRDIIEAALAYALAMTKNGEAVRRDFLERFRCVVTLTISAGPLSPAERAAIVTEYEKGLRSRESTMALLGVEDVDAELALIAGSEDARLARLKAQVEVLDLLARATSLEAALRAMAAAGMDPAVIAALRPRDTDGLVDEEAGADGGAGEEDEEDDDGSPPARKEAA